jgi:hypothetical protein
MPISVSRDGHLVYSEMPISVSRDGHLAQTRCPSRETGMLAGVILIQATFKHKVRKGLKYCQNFVLFMKNFVLFVFKMARNYG